MKSNVNWKDEEEDDCCGYIDDKTCVDDENYSWCIGNDDNLNGNHRKFCESARRGKI